METKETPTIVMQEKAKADFEVYLKKHLLLINLKNMLALEFEDYPFEMQSGVYTAYLRGKGIEAKTLADKQFFKIGYKPVVYLIKPEGFIWKWSGEFNPGHNTALISAINEGFRIVEEQLKDKENDS